MTAGTVTATDAGPSAPAAGSGDGVAILAYRLTALSRVSAGRSGEVLFSREIHEVIPGSTIRGALAAAWLAGDVPAGVAGRRFRELFERFLIVRPAIPSGMSLEPMSLRWCKYPLLSLGAGRSACDRGRDDAAAYSGESPPRACPQPGCGGGVETGRGYAWDRRGTGRSPTVAVVRTALNADGVAEDEQLFTRRALERDTVLRGSIVLLDPDRLAAELEWLRTPRHLRVGGQRSVLGLVAWTASDVPAPAPRRTPQRAVLRFTSSAILVDEYGAATLDPGPTLRRLWPRAVVERTWARPVRVGGWHAASGLPKPEDWALEAGSTFVMSGLPADAGGQLMLGIGLRRLEGFGAVELLDQAALPRFSDPAPPDDQTPEAHIGPASAPAGVIGVTTDSTGGADAADSLGTEPLPPTPAETPVGVAAEPERGVLDGLKAVVPAERWPHLLQQLGAGVLKVQLAQSAGFTGSALDGKRDEVLLLPWAMQLGYDARRRLLELLAVEDLAGVRRAIVTEKEAHR